MIPGKAVHTLFLSFFSLSLSLLCSFFWVQDIWSSNFPLDEEAVFCLYHRLSGNPVVLQDIEELCYQVGRPAYTSFKPSEMFMKRKIREVRTRIEEKIKRMKEESLFIWRFKASVIPHDRNPKGYRIVYRENEMPQATSFIISEISKEGQVYLNGLLNAFIKKRSDHTESAEELEIVVSLRPEKVAYRYQKRNIALEDVVLPIRCVIFHPVNVMALDKRLTIQEGNR